MKNWTKILWLGALLALGYFTFTRWGNIADYISDDIRRFVQAQGHYEKLYAYFPPSQEVKQARDILPPNARVQISSPSSTFGLHFIAIRYYFYPCIITDEWDYFVDFDNTGIIPPGAVKSMRLPSGHYVHAKEGHDFKYVKKDHISLFSKYFIFFLGISLWLVFIGALILIGFRLCPREGTRAWFYGLSYLIGVLVSTVLLWLLLLTSIKLNPATVYALMAALTVLAVLYARRSRREPLLSADAPPPAADRRAGLTEFAGKWISFCIIAIMLVIIIAIPIRAWDEMFIWIIKARHFCVHQGFDFSYSISTNNYYPLLWPLHNSFYFTLVGDYDEISKWITALVYLAFITQLRAAFLFLGIDKKFGWGLTALYLILFHHWTFHAALPENLLMAFLTAMTACMLARLKYPASAVPYIPLAFLMAVGLSLTKFEGAPIAILCACSMLIMYKALALRKAEFLCLVGCVLAFILPWAWIQWVQVHGTPVTYYHLNGAFSWENVHTLVDIIRKFLVGTWCIFLAPILLLSFRLYQNPALRNQEMFLCLVAGGLLVLALSGGLLWPTADFQKDYPEVFTRLLVRTTPFLALLWAGRLLVRPRH